MPITAGYILAVFYSFDLTKQSLSIICKAWFPVCKSRKSLYKNLFIMNMKLLIPIAFKSYDLADDAGEIVLAGDVGGTKANMLLCRIIPDGIETIKEKRFASKDHSSFAEILIGFLEGQPKPQKMCLSVAGPVLDGKVKFTNLSWQLDSAEISEKLGNIPVAIINDLEATAYGLAALKPDELHLLHKGSEEAKGNAAILAAGTGLGEAGLFFDGKNYHPFATEGGHSDFAPRNEQDIKLLSYLQQRHQHVSWERLLSGTGIVTIWQFFRDVLKKTSPEWLVKQMDDNDPAAVISKAAVEKSCSVCEEVIALFNHYLAIEAVNLVLKIKATGGLYLAGGIAPKILPLLDPKVWEEVFEASGRMRQLMAQVTVNVMLNEKAPLLGAAYYATGNM